MKKDKKELRKRKRHELEDDPTKMYGNYEDPDTQYYNQMQTIHHNLSQESSSLGLQDLADHRNDANNKFIKKSTKKSRDKSSAGKIKSKGKVSRDKGSRGKGKEEGRKSYYNNDNNQYSQKRDNKYYDNRR